MTPRSPLMMGVDAGTTNIKAVIVDAGGIIVAEASVATPVRYPAPEWAEYIAEDLWQTAAKAMRDAVAKLDDPSQLVGVAVASMGETAVPLDAAGTPTAPAIAWFDKRARAQLAMIEDCIGYDRLFAITGLSPEPIFGLCKLLWLRDNLLDAYAHTVKWLNVADYLAWRLCGEMATDFSLACRTFALDLGALDWSHEIMESVEVKPDIMAPLAKSGQALGRVTNSAAAATGLPTHCMVCAGGHDHIIGAIAADAMRPGILLNSTGTTEAALVGVDRPCADPELGRAGYAQGVSVVDSPVWYVIGGLFTAGGAIDWYRQNFADGIDYDCLIAEAHDVPQGSLGAGFLPHLRLGSGPNPDLFARGAFFGLSTDHTRGHLFRSVLEGVAADTRLCAEGMLARIPVAEPEAIRVIGGITRNTLYMEIKAAMAGRAITVVDLPDSVAMGAALLAGLGAGVYANQSMAVRAMGAQERQIEASGSAIEFYARLLNQVYRPAYETIKPLNQAAHKVISELPR